MFRAPLISTIASWAASASNLFGAVTKGRPVSAATVAATFSAKPILAFRPVPTAAGVRVLRGCFGLVGVGGGRCPQLQWGDALVGGQGESQQRTAGQRAAGRRSQPLLGTPQLQMFTRREPVFAPVPPCASMHSRGSAASTRRMPYST